MRSGVCKSSSSSSISRRQICACGDEVALIKSSTTKNPGRMFLRCPNCDVSRLSAHFVLISVKMLLGI
ncbi:hypothetical protein SESBI_20544 [Sesbania bispinosa]|nr:hypothetical protein SESBI_20544 [Sesbania bispinosa]